MQSPRSYAYPTLFIGVAAVSCAAVLIRKADAPALVIAAYRLGLAAVPAGAFALATGPRRPLSEGALAWSALSGVLLALHFGFWIASIQQTSVITSVVLVTTTPLFIGLASPFVLGERVAAATWWGIAIATAGAALMVAEDAGEGLGTLRGDVFALLGALFAAGYLMTGRYVRPRISAATYIGIVYPVAGALLIGSALAVGESFTGYSLKTFVMFGLLALIPQLIGHTSINWALGFIPAALVAIAILGEPVGATALAAAVLGEMPNGLEVAGGLVVLSGVYVALRPSGLRAPEVADEIGTVVT